MKDYQLTTNEPIDIVIINGDHAIVSDSTATKQRLNQKFKLWRGEWFLNTSAGVPWLEDILGKKPRTEVLQTLFSQVIQSDPGIKTLQSLSFEYNEVERKLQITFQATLINNTVLDMEVDI